ncbi:hypothetical protein BJ741DRAFT_599246 [Chytriomyces cf. hyalinus JEL632]|nr:hypothetical protein BJ741DRAFT_599246 [Chytriomyces cf. hyalinus JEL632]
MSKHRHITTQALVRFPWRLTAAPVPAPVTHTPTDTSHVSRFLLNPIKRKASALTAHAIASSALGPDYFDHDFSVGVEAAFPQLCSALSVTSLGQGNREQLASMVTAPLLNAFSDSIKLMPDPNTKIKLNASVHDVQVLGTTIRYGQAPASFRKLRLKCANEDGTQLFAFVNGTSGFSEGDFLYKCNNFEWVFPRHAVLQTGGDVTEALFASEAAQVMDAGFTIQVRATLDADVEFALVSATLDVQERSRRDIQVCFESSLIPLEDANHGLAASKVEWKVADLNGILL